MNDLIKYKVDRQLLLLLTCAFIVATVIGTLTHECGHYLVAKSLGYDARISYGSTWLKSSAGSKPMSLRDNFFSTLGGPLETILTGTTGFILLILFRKSYQSAQRLSLGQWALIFISLFWLRQTANFAVWIGKYLMTGEFSSRSDEIKLSKMLHLPYFSITLLTAIMGGIVLVTVILKFIPVAQRFTFILSGIIGGVAGYLLWLEWLGKIIIP